MIDAPPDALPDAASDAAADDTPMRCRFMMLIIDADYLMYWQENGEYEASDALLSEILLRAISLNIG